MTDDIQDRLDTLESLVEHQQETIEKQRERIAELEGETPSDGETDRNSPISRRSALKAGGLVGLIGLGASTASADAQGQVGASSDPLEAVYTEELNGGVTGDQTLTDLFGDGLALSDGELTTDLGDGLEFDSGRTGVNGGAVAGNVLSEGTNPYEVDLDIGTGLEDNTGTLAVQSGGIGTTELATPFADLASLFGSSITAGGAIQSPTGSALTFNTNGGDRALQLGVPGEDSRLSGTGGGNIIAGHPNNEVTKDSAVGAVIGGGGGSLNSENTVGEDYTTVCGGLSNTANGVYATIGGGRSNTVSGGTATIGGGASNTASALFTTIGGGKGNKASGERATVGGGASNTASGKKATVGGGKSNEANAEGTTVGGGESNTASDRYATVAGGRNSSATAQDAFAAGRNAKAKRVGAFAWGDSTDKSIEVVNPNSFEVQASGGAVIYSNGDTDKGVVLHQDSGSWTSLSTRTAKTDISPVDPSEVLAGVESLDVATWQYDGKSNADHMGPMAEEFHDEFGLGENERHIATVDADGVALAAIQGLSEKLEGARAELDAENDRITSLESTVERKDERIDEQQNRIDDLERETDDLREENDRLRERNADLETRLDRIEAHLGIDESSRQGVADD